MCKPANGILARFERGTQGFCCCNRGGKYANGCRRGLGSFGDRLFHCFVDSRGDLLNLGWHRTFRGRIIETCLVCGCLRLRFLHDVEVLAVWFEQDSNPESLAGYFGIDQRAILQSHGGKNAVVLVGLLHIEVQPHRGAGWQHALQKGGRLRAQTFNRLIRMLCLRGVDVEESDPLVLTLKFDDQSVAVDDPDYFARLGVRTG